MQSILGIADKRMLFMCITPGKISRVYNRKCSVAVYERADKGYHHKNKVAEKTEILLRKKS